ncbi:hypothetical protein J6590_090838, partial [Homalodisca vitripennis]
SIGNISANTFTNNVKYQAADVALQLTACEPDCHHVTGSEILSTLDEITTAGSGIWQFQIFLNSHSYI